MRFAFLGSGSRGNAALVEVNGTCVMIDCGFSAREAEGRLARLGKTPADLSAILVTHEHSDHLGGVAPFARRHRIPVWMTVGTRVNSVAGELPALHLFSSHEPFSLDGLAVHPYPVPHDAREPAQFVFDDGARRLGVLTDAGAITAHMEGMLMDCDGLLLECNHDPHLLATGPYPPSLKARVGGRYGHLSNEQAAGILYRVKGRRLQHVVAAHLSEKNNRPDLARNALSNALGCEPEWISVADQDRGLGWRELV